MTGLIRMLYSFCAAVPRPLILVARISVVLGGVSQDETSNALVIEMILVGGKNRTLMEFEELASQVGVEIRATGWQPAGRFVVECAPV